jgi:hypothetical protein
MKARRAGLLDRSERHKGACVWRLGTALDPLRYCPMMRKLSREDDHAQALLNVAGYWRKSAAETTDPGRRDAMRHTAEDFEKAAARAAW